MKYWSLAVESFGDKYLSGYNGEPSPEISSNSVSFKRIRSQNSVSKSEDVNDLDRVVPPQRVRKDSKESSKGSKENRKKTLETEL